METPIKRVLLDDSNSSVIGIETLNGEIHHANTVVSTMPITLLLKGFDHVPDQVQQAADKLYFRNTILVYLEIDKKDLFTDNWLYIHSPDVTHGLHNQFQELESNPYKEKRQHHSLYGVLVLWSRPDLD